MSSSSRRNRLADATSPYLLQHASNPVDWYPWGEEALARARAEHKPILLSIGYSACHWCHVMAHESFEDEATATLMNRHFVNIKVDREERPDLDDIYMAATLAMNHGQGGWPMTVFLTPDQQPFFAGTYFPPEDRHGRPGFPTLLRQIAQAWEQDRDALVEQGGRLVEHLRENARPAPGAGVGEDTLKAAATQLGRAYDARWGGFGGAPKFPPAETIRLLLRAHRRTGDAKALEMATGTLDAMARGGLYDHVAGGFCRYATDQKWLVPHFEKMLYDNALLARAYLEAFQVTGEARHARVARETLDYLLREMTGPGGGFFSATDADSEGEEGRFFVWTPEQVEAALGDAELARRFCEYYDVTRSGNWEGHSIPNLLQEPEVSAKRLGVPLAELEASVEQARPQVLAARNRRVQPGLDDKVLTAWNGLAISAFAEGHRVLREPRYLAAAEAAATFVRDALTTADGRLLRSWRAGVGHIPGYLEDYAYLGEGLVDLYEAGGAEAHLREAERLAQRMLVDFGGEDGGFWQTARDAEELIVRHREGHDGATPAANACAASLLARLSFHLDRPAWRDEAARALRAWGRAVARQPRAFSRSLIVADFLQDGPLELALVGAPGDEAREALEAELARHFVAARVVAHAAGEGASTLPLLVGRGLVEGRPALYVCRDYTCRRPVTEPAEVAAALADPPPPSRAAGGIEAGRLEGFATAEGTARYAARQRAAGRLAAAFGPLGACGLTVGRLGFGGYRVEDETAAHHQALVEALASGVNLLDTSTNYMDGGSERLYGEVLAELCAEHQLARDEVVVVSKIGYLQGENFELAKAREEEGKPFPEVVQYDEDLWHCLHPEFLADQLARSLDRLQLRTLDVLLLHNPEYFLKDAHERSRGTIESRRAEFDERVTAAFRALEGFVAAGRIRAYGVSSNTIGAPDVDAESTSLERFLACAREAGGERHHFQVLQLPMNLLEADPLLEKKHAGRSTLDVAREAGLAVLVNRPLNAMYAGGLLRLADHEVVGDAGDVDAAAAAVEALEEEWRQGLAVQLQADGPLPPAEFFRFGSELPQAAQVVSGLPHWEQIEGHRVMPRLQALLRALDGALAGPAGREWQDWRQRYLPTLRRLLDAVRARAMARSRETLAPVRAALLRHAPAAASSAPTSQLALAALLAAPGVSCVLVGMRQPAWVKDAMAAPGLPVPADPAALFAATRNAV
ncbi:MAG: DUF255 domain-containing protein [Vicinamibacteria bacterium]|nr:DUF255 domain-containing protein [Vicinamibacteria bacterium]